MSKRVMVASRAVRRGRRLKARSTMPPPPKAADPGAAEPISDEPSQETAIEPAAPESGEGLVGERRPSEQPTADGAREVEAVAQPASLEEAAPAPIEQESDEDEDDDASLDRISGYSRPPAPTFDFGGAAEADASLLDDEEDFDDPEDEDDEASLLDDDEETSRLDDIDENDEASLLDDDEETSRLDDIDEDDEDDEDDREDASQPSSDVAMAFDEDVEEPTVLTPITRKVFPHDGEDPNATTLVSVPSPRRGSTPPPSRIAIEEAAPSSDRLLSAEHEDDVQRESDDFVPVGDEPPLSAPAPVAVEPAISEPSPSSPIADVTLAYRNEDASLAPVVDDVALEEEAEAALAAVASKRRDSFRRGVGAVLAAIVVGTVALVTVSALRGGGEADSAVAPVAAAPADEAPAPVADAPPSDGEAAAAAEPTSAEESVEEAAPVAGDYDALSTQTLELLNDREFDAARALAEKLVALEPDNAFGYRCLGSALQDMGKVVEAREIYSQCVSKATKGEVTECRALGGAKR